MKLRLRPIVRSTLRRPFRSLNRSCLRGRRRGPDDLAQALTAFRRAIRAHRRMARLAPSFFDVAVIERERENRAERRRWAAVWEPVVAKVYGVDPQPPSTETEFPPLPSPRIQAAVNRHLAGWRFWMAAGRAAMERQQQRRPHALPSLSRLARWLDLAFEFKKLALGLDSPNPLPEKISYDYELTDFKRAFGQQNKPPPPVAVVPAETVAHDAAIDSENGSARTDATQPSQPPAAAPPVVPRCDAWSRLARQRRMR